MRFFLFLRFLHWNSKRNLILKFQILQKKQDPHHFQLTFARFNVKKLHKSELYGYEVSCIDGSLYKSSTYLIYVLHTIIS